MSVFHRITNLFARSKMEHEIDAELRSHIEMRIEDNIANGGGIVLNLEISALNLEIF